jgi:hypothetical protein
MNERQIKLKEFMAWCNTNLLKWKPDLTANFVKNFDTEAIIIKKLEKSTFMTSVVMKNVIEVVDEIGLSCFFEQDNGEVQIEIK